MCQVVAEEEMAEDQANLAPEGEDVKVGIPSYL